VSAVLSRISALAREQNILNAFERQERLRVYRMKLEDADWHFQLAEGQYFRDGLREFAWLYAEQAEVDPSGAIWNSIKPQGFCVPQPRVEVAL
jgi:hypothetical protein